MKVFISSTCYDLVDLRAELFQDLTDLGVDPLFSDLKESSFQASVEPDVNSIETCLENVRASDVIVVILSQRYGPRLRSYANVSATHLEYQEARKHNRKVHFYVRDRLIADWTAWKRNDGSYSPTWAKGEDATGLFAFVNEHPTLAGGIAEPGANNWYWPYRTSVDLRADIRKRLELNSRARFRS